MNKNKVLLLAKPASLSLLRDGLTREPELEIVFSASKTEDIIAFINKPVLYKTGLLCVADCTSFIADKEFFQELREKGIPTVALTDSVNEGFKLLEQGASDMIVKRGNETGYTAYFNRMLVVHIQDTLKKFSENRQRAVTFAPHYHSGKIVAIGSSTGGTETVLEILKQMPADAPPILVVQHMPPVFTKLYADRANDICAIKVWEASDGDGVSNGLALIAPGDYHMTLNKKNGQYFVECKPGERICNQCPSVDVLFNSVAQVAKENAVGVILTGMGSDGANGLLKMHRQGAYTIGQDRETCVVYGMPRAAYELGAVSEQLPLDKIPQAILEHAATAAK